MKRIVTVKIPLGAAPALVLADALYNIQKIARKCSGIMCSAIAANLTVQLNGVTIVDAMATQIANAYPWPMPMDVQLAPDSAFTVGFNDPTGLSADEYVTLVFDE